jgi:aryl-alcohol dehydrogenase-like predicted oxidoreductase
MDPFPLGRFSVARIGFGAIQLPGRAAFGPPRDRDAALAVLRRAVELGVNHIDTAQFYGPDVSNELIREALYPYLADLALVSKVGAAVTMPAAGCRWPTPPTSARTSRPTCARSASISWQL